MTLDTAAPLLSALTLHRPQAYILAFAAGAVSSLGPCALPRCIAAAGLASRSFRESVVRFAVLQSGLTAGYCILGLGSSVLAALVRHSIAFYVALAALLFFSGLRLLMREHTSCSGSSTPRRAPGGTFLLGTSFAFVVSPCCTPIVLAVGTLSPAPAYAASIMAVFAAGHGVTMLAAVTGAQALQQRLRAAVLERASGLFSGTLLIALSAYYAVLA